MLIHHRPSTPSRKLHSSNKSKPLPENKCMSALLQALREFHHQLLMSVSILQSTLPRLSINQYVFKYPWLFRGFRPIVDHDILVWNRWDLRTVVDRISIQWSWSTNSGNLYIKWGRHPWALEATSHIMLFWPYFGHEIIWYSPVSAGHWGWILSRLGWHDIWKNSSFYSLFFQLESCRRFIWKFMAMPGACIDSWRSYLKPPQNGNLIFIRKDFDIFEPVHTASTQFANFKISHR